MKYLISENKIKFLNYHNLLQLYLNSVIVFINPILHLSFTIHCPITFLLLITHRLYPSNITNCMVLARLLWFRSLKR